MDTKIVDSFIEQVYAFIREAHLQQDCLPEIIGKALDKKAVLLILIDVDGGITTVGDSAPENVRDRSMVLQMSELLNNNMDRMMKQAGKEARESLPSTCVCLDDE